MLQRLPAEAANGRTSLHRSRVRLCRSPLLSPLVGLCAALLLLLLSLPAHAQAGNSSPSALVVFGKADLSMQEVVYTVVDRLLRDAGWPLVPPLASNDATVVRGCLSKEAAWACVEPMATKKGIQRIVAVRVELERSADGTSQIVLTGRLVYAGSSSVLEQKRYCGACSKEDLTAYAEEIAKDLLDDRAVAAGTTKVGVSSTPMGAEVRIDGKVVGVTNNVFSTFPGRHTIEVRAPRHQAASTTVTAIDGKTVVATLSLTPAAPGSNPNEPIHTEPAISVEGGSEGSGGTAMFRKWGPKAMVGAGGVMVVTGLVYIFVLDENETVFDSQAEYENDMTFDNWAPAGAGLLVAGAVVGGVGGYLWWRWRPTGDVTPAVSPTSNGAMMSLSGSF